jgi:uncharacterized protein
MTSDRLVVPVERTTDGKVIIRVHVQPRSTRNRCSGVHDDSLKLAVNAPPVDGKANKEVGRYLAELLGVSRKSVILLSGSQSRKKVFWLESLSEQEAQVKIAALIASADG